MKRRSAFPDETDATAQASGLVGPVIRGLRLLEYIAQGGSTDNLSEVGRLIDVNRVTVMRLLATLEHEGMIEKLPGGGHRVGLRYLTMAATALGSHDLVSAGRRVVRDLCQKTGHAAYMSLLDGSDITYVLREMPPAGLVSLITIGSRVAAWRAAPGRAMLAALPVDVVENLPGLDALRATDADAFATLESQLALIRDQGCAWSYSGLEQGITACAVAVTGASGQPVAALSVAGPSLALDDDTVKSHLHASLLKSATQLSAIATIDQ